MSLYLYADAHHCVLMSFSRIMVAFEKLSQLFPLEARHLKLELETLRT